MILAIFLIHLYNSDIMDPDELYNKYLQNIP